MLVAELTKVCARVPRANSKGTRPMVERCIATVPYRQDRLGRLLGWLLYLPEAVDSDFDCNDNSSSAGDEEALYAPWEWYFSRSQIQASTMIPLSSSH